MVTTTHHYSESRYQTPPGTGYDGVVRVQYGGFYGTGSLLYDGRAILTSAHLFEGRNATASVSFETVGGVQSRSISKILLHPGHDANSNNDL